MYKGAVKYNDKWVNVEITLAFLYIKSILYVGGDYQVTYHNESFILVSSDIGEPLMRDFTKFIRDRTGTWENTFDFGVDDTQSKNITD